MQRHTKTYMDYFGLSEGDYIGSELSNSPSGPPHHIILKSAGGKDNIENLMALTPEEHELAHFKGTLDESKWLRADYLQKKHNKFIKRYNENNTSSLYPHNKIRN